MSSSQYRIATVRAGDLENFLDTANAWLKKHDYEFRLRGQANGKGLANIYTYSAGGNSVRVNSDRTVTSRLRSFLSGRFSRDYVGSVWNTRAPHNADLATV